MSDIATAPPAAPSVSTVALNAALAAPAAPAAPVSPPAAPAAPAVSLAEPAVVSPIAEPATPAEPASPGEVRPAHELQASFLDDEPKDLPPPAKDSPVDPASPDAAPAEKDVAAVEAAPTVYDFAYPEGFSKEAVDQERFNEFSSLLNTVKAPQEQAQKFLDMHLAEVQRAQVHALDQVWQSYHRQQNEWKSQIRDDREFGGDNLPRSKAEANAFIEQYGGSPENQAQLRRDLFSTGAGNSPALVAAMIRAGRALSREGTPVVAPPPRQAPPSRVQRGLNRYAASNTPGSS